MCDQTTYPVSRHEVKTTTLWSLTKHVANDSGLPLPGFVTPRVTTKTITILHIITCIQFDMEAGLPKKWFVP